LKITLLGKAPGKEKIPKDVEHLWGVNDLILELPKLGLQPLTTTFEMHDLDKHRNLPFIVDELKAFKEAGIPVITKQHYDFVPNCVPFPFDEMHCQYFTSSIAYMIAYAIYKGADEIDLYGIQMATRVEFTNQRPCCEYWLGYAEGKGIKIFINRPSQLIFSPKGRYGVDWDNLDQGHAWPDAVVSNQKIGETPGVFFAKI
jgi:hypothetical protein